MTHVYYLRHVPQNADANRLRLTRDVRAAMRYIDSEATASDAEACIGAVRENGYGILGVMEGDEPEALAVLDALSTILADSHCEVVRNLDTERADQRWRERQAREAGMTPEQVFAGDPVPEEPQGPQESNVRRIPVVSRDIPTEVMAALLVPCDGNPLQAAALAINLRRIDGNKAHWDAVVAAYVRVFPWVEEPLRHGGLL